MKLQKQPTRPSARFLSDTARCMQVLALSTVLSACGGGESGSSSKPAPSITGITPATATINVPVTLTVTGQNLPLTAVLSMADAACEAPTAQTATGFRATCTATTAGVKLVTVQTNTPANGGTVIDGTHSVVVAAAVLPVGTPNVTAITPNTATINVPVTLTVTGQNLPLTAVLSMADAACEAPAAQTAIGFSITCTAATAGNKLLTVRTNTPANGGTVIDSTRSVNVTGILPDTGITASQCYAAGSNTLVSCTSTAAIALNDKQDGMLGRDVSHADSSDGKLGFSYTKLDASGNALPASATSWSCVKDNLTGLTWEVKTADGGLRDMNKFYTNYDDATRPQKWNGSAFVNPTQAEIDAATNTVGFVAAVNAISLCGHADWRLPSVDELQSIVDYGVASPGPMVDSASFINTRRDLYWSSSSDVSNGSSAWTAWSVGFTRGNVGADGRHTSSAVRLVR